MGVEKSKKNLRLSALVSVLLICAASLAACAPTPQAAPSPTVTREAATPNAAPVPSITPGAVSQINVNAADLRGVTITVWHPWFGPEAALFESQVADFNSNNPWGITVLTISQNNYSELFENVTASLAAPDKPQLVIGLPEHALVWNSQSGVVDWNPYVNDPKWGWSAQEVADFSPVFLNQDEVDGKRLALPAERTARFLFYNQSWAHDLGFDSPPTTSDAFRQQACAANKALRSNSTPSDDGRGGWYVDADPMTPLAWMDAFGGGVTDGTTGYRFLRPENISFFQFIKTLYDDGCAWRADDTDAIDAFANRQSLFITGSLEDFPAVTRAINTAGSSDQWTILPFPGPARSDFVVYGSSFIMLPSTDQQQLAAWLFVRTILSSENQVRWVQTTGMFPLRISTMTLAADYAASYPQWVTAVKLLPQADVPPQLPSWRLVRVMLGDGFDSMFRVNTPVGQIAAILAQMDSTASDLMK